MPMGLIEHSADFFVADNLQSVCNLELVSGNSQHAIIDFMPTGLSTMATDHV